MGCTVHTFSLLGVHSFHRDRYIGAVRLHDFYGIAHAEFVPLLDPAQRILYCLHNSQINIFVHVSVIIIDLRIFIRLAEIEPRRKLTIGALGDLCLVPVHIFLVQLRIGK